MTEDRYEIIKLLGKGRTGGVYEAEDSNLGRKVALRRFFAQSKNTGLDEYKIDFENVAHSLSALQHPNLLRVYDAGVDSDGAYIISQLLVGETLQAKIQDGAIPLWEVYDLAQQMLDALSLAHREGFVHGAITPGSILMSSRARGGYLYVILDMGLSRLAPLIQGKDSILSIMADPAILAPELFDGGIASERADLYMLGQIFYMCLAGGHPFGGVSVKEAEQLHYKGLPSIREFDPTIPDDFRIWLERLIQINPAHRPSSAVEALNSLPKVQQPARKHSEAVYAATAHLRPKATTALIAPAGPVTDPLSNHTTAPSPVPSPAPSNPLLSYGPRPVAGTSVMRAATGQASPRVGVGGLASAQKSSKKGLYMTLTALAAISAIFGTMMMSGSGKKKGNVAIVIDEPRNTTSPYSGRNAVTAEEGVITNFEGTKEKHFKGWQYAGKAGQSLTEEADGWRIKTDIGNAPERIVGILFPLRSVENDMYDQGWKLTYIVRPVAGSHRVGFTFDEKTNPGWAGDTVSLCLAVEHTSDGNVKLYAMDCENEPKTAISVTVPYNGDEGWHTIVVEQKPEAQSGAYSVTLDGQTAFEDILSPGTSSRLIWNNNLQSSVLANSLGGDWVIKQLKLETL